jgi:hypothetical protein
MILSTGTIIRIDSQGGNPALPNIFQKGSTKRSPIIRDINSPFIAVLLDTGSKHAEPLRLETQGEY